MKILLSVLLTLCSVVWGKDVSLPALPISEYVDTEISTNIVLGTTFADFREINIEVSSSKDISNLVEVSFGKDISLDGILSAKEVGLVFKLADAYAMCSYRDTNVFLHESEQMITNAVMNLTFLSDGNIQSFNIALNGDIVAELPKPPLTKDIMSRWDLMRVVRRGSSISNEHIDIRIATDMTILLLK
jgi:hypothetical protein